MGSVRKALIVFGICAVLYVIALPALPDTGGMADDLVWLLSVFVALTGIGALVIAYRLHTASSRHAEELRPR